MTPSNIIDLILNDHKFIKQGLLVLIDPDADSKQKLAYAKPFLVVLQKHSEAEKNVLYPAFEYEDDYRAEILESYIEHEIVDQKVKTLRRKVSHARSLSDSLAAELKVLAELVQDHLLKEESELLPQIKDEIDEEILLELGAEFMKKRKFTDEELVELPLLQNELLVWKDSIQKDFNQKLSKMDAAIEEFRR